MDAFDTKVKRPTPFQPIIDALKVVHRGICWEVISSSSLFSVYAEDWPGHDLKANGTKILLWDIGRAA